MASAVYDYENWMGSLPDSLHSLPLNHLAIPGSHDSASYSLNAKNDIAPDTSPEIQALISVMGDCGKEIIYRWSLCQNITITQQLNHGIRYLDLRVCSHKKKKTLNFIHGLYGDEVKPVLNDINQFLDKHRKEIVLLDFNHFYCMDQSDHTELMDMIQDVFGSKLCPLLDMESATLESLWENQLQVIVFYQNDAAKDNHFFWPATSIRSPWANTSQLSNLMSFLESNYKEGHPDDIFYVWQGVLTPTTETVVMHFCSSLKDCLCNKVDPIFVSWLKDKRRGKNGITICNMDYVETPDYIPTILSLNKI
ncbi:hypothetical protein FSP39_023435 [Pinctada imbricata]|uniref:Phosphatidylinositol-specific phospholipase C X domain-containing protein n=1 Tax=Pinctada imbricata TaxID=66713 RepID=A0AA88YEQ8_PINIB|nr:hypothetical protein FSP39_023435 [Pinctada imbricata]